MNRQNIAVVLSERDLSWLSDVMLNAAQNSRKVSFFVDGGLKIKVAESVWTLPIGTTLAELED